MFGNFFIKRFQIKDKISKISVILSSVAMFFVSVFRSDSEKNVYENDFIGWLHIFFVMIFSLFFIIFIVNSIKNLNKSGEGKFILITKILMGLAIFFEIIFAIGLFFVVEEILKVKGAVEKIGFSIFLIWTEVFSIDFFKKNLQLLK